MTYTTLVDALDRAKERSGAADVDDTYLTELLILSAGKAPDNTIHYRPFYVAAKWLEQNLASQQISEADGAKFTGQATPIASLLALQASYDSANELTIPKGFEAVTVEAAQEQQQKRGRRFGTGSYSPELQA